MGNLKNCQKKQVLVKTVTNYGAPGIPYNKVEGVGEVLKSQRLQAFI